MINSNELLGNLLKQYGFDIQDFDIQQFDSGLINKTWKIGSKKKTYIIQKINEQVFKKPEDIDKNLLSLKDFLDTQYPGYLFVAPIPNIDGSTLIHTVDGYFRAFDFIEGSETLNFVSTGNEAYEAAKQFGKLSKLLSEFNTDKLRYTLPNFHNLPLRYRQFHEANTNASEERLKNANEAIISIQSHADIVETFNKVLSTASIPLRVIHHDTKISNVLFNKHKKGLCVIDLDTIMPGYFISDTGDMMRTYLSAANEEETDFNKIEIRQDIFEAICSGYFSEMGDVLTTTEIDLFIYSGEFMIYMQAIRFLTDYLNNDVYYGAKYPEQNLNRALNQITLLEKYLINKPLFREFISKK